MFVTHDQEEAFELADRVAILNDGRIEQVGRPSEVLDRPATPFVKDFIEAIEPAHGRAKPQGELIRLERVRRAAR